MNLHPAPHASPCWASSQGAASVDRDREGPEDGGGREAAAQKRGVADKDEVRARRQRARFAGNTFSGEREIKREGEIESD